MISRILQHPAPAELSLSLRWVHLSLDNPPSEQPVLVVREAPFNSSKLLNMGQVMFAGL